MTKVNASHYPDEHHDEYSKTTFGFWVYLLTDFMMFATLFAAYTVFDHSTFGGPGAREIFYPPYNFVETVIFLISAFTIGIGGAYVHRKNRMGTIIFFLITFILGCLFMAMQIHEFALLMSKGHSWKNSAFLTSYYTLVGTHTAHMAIALIWLVALIIPVFSKGIEKLSLQRLTCLKMFWQFLSIIWFFIFTIVYLMGSELV